MTDRRPCPICGCRDTRQDSAPWQALLPPLRKLWLWCRYCEGYTEELMEHARAADSPAEPT